MNFSNRIPYDVVRNRKKFFLFSILLTLAGIVSLLIVNLNLGVDFKAGTTMDVLIGKQITQQETINLLDQEGYVGLKPTVGGTNNDRASIRFEDVLVQSEINQIQSAFMANYGDQVSFEVNIVSPDMARELGIKTIWAVLIASVAIMIYVMFRFEWTYAVASIIAILYDAFVVVAIFSIFQLEVDLTFIAAVLTTIGYSINDKVVVFDRVRENMRFTKVKNNEQLVHLVNASIWQTMARNLYTVLAVLIVAVFLFFLGSESIKLFALAQIIGLISGAYSTIFIASPLWYAIKSKQKPKAAVKSSPQN